VQFPVLKYQLGHFEKWCKGLCAIAELKGLQRRVVVYHHGPVLRTEDGIDVMALDHFARLLAENRLYAENRRDGRIRNQQ
jgi:hypothetical protein